MKGKIRLYSICIISACHMISCGGESTKTAESNAATDTVAKVENQVPPPPPETKPYSQDLVYEKLGFGVSSPQRATGNSVLVVPRGFAASNDSIRMDVEGVVVNAETADISGDNSPELLIVTRDARNFGHAYVFSGNKNKSVSMVNLADAAETKGALDGYQGEDEFALVENSLVRRFPVYANSAKTGKMRQIQFKLKNGEAMKQLKVDKVMEY